MAENHRWLTVHRLPKTPLVDGGTA